MRRLAAGASRLVRRVAGINWTAASTGSSLRGKALLSERTLTPMGAGGEVGCASGELRVSRDSGRDTCFVAIEIPGVSPLVVTVLAVPGAIRHAVVLVRDLDAYPNVTYFNEVDKGGHFAAWEEPELFSERDPEGVPTAPGAWSQEVTSVVHNYRWRLPGLAECKSGAM